MITFGRQLLDHETKVDTDALVEPGRVTRVCSTVSSLPQFSTSADRTGVEFGGNGHLENTASILVEVGDTSRMEMAKMLMPQEDSWSRVRW
jgi:hypothetical protein